MNLLDPESYTRPFVTWANVRGKEKVEDKFPIRVLSHPGIPKNSERTIGHDDAPVS